MQAWTSNDVSENWADDFLSIISEKYHVLPFNSSTTHFVGHTNNCSFWLELKINNGSFWPFHISKRLTILLSIRNFNCSKE